MDETFKGHMVASVVVGTAVYITTNAMASEITVLAALVLSMILLQHSLQNWVDKRAAYRIIRGLYREVDPSLKPLLDIAIESEGLILQEILKEPDED